MAAWFCRTTRKNVQRRKTLACGAVHVSAVLDQRFDTVSVSTLRCHVQWRGPTVVTFVDISTAQQQRFHALYKSQARRDVQQRDVIAHFGVDVSTKRCQRRYEFRVVCDDSHEQWTVVIILSQHIGFRSVL